jgi:hypothetical protein
MKKSINSLKRERGIPELFVWANYFNYKKNLLQVNYTFKLA